MNRHVGADERAMLARTRPNAFDQLRDTGKLGVGMWTEPVEIKAQAARRWAVGEALRRLHAQGWQNPCRGVANPLDGAEAVAARAALADVAHVIGDGLWFLVLRVVITGDSLSECGDLVPPQNMWVAAGRTDEELLLDRLSLALDRIESLLAPST